MFISIREAPGNKTHNVEVEVGDNIQAIKAKVEAISGIPSADQKFLFAGKEMTNDKMLSDYSFAAESTIYLVKIVVKYKININTPNGEILEFEVDKNTTIKTLKEKITEKINTSKFSLEYANSNLSDDSATLSSHSITQDATVLLTFPPPPSDPVPQPVVQPTPVPVQPIYQEPVPIQQPFQPSYQAPVQSFQAPVQPSYQAPAPSYQAPVPIQPIKPSYQAPAAAQQPVLQPRMPAQPSYLPQAPSAVYQSIPQPQSPLLVDSDTTWECLDIKKMYLILHDKHSIVVVKSPICELPSFPNTLPQSTGNSQQAVLESIVGQFVQNTSHEMQRNGRTIPTKPYFGLTLNNAPKFYFSYCLIYVIELSRDIYQFVSMKLPRASSHTIQSIPSILLEDLSKVILFDQNILKAISPSYEPQTQVNNWNIPTTQTTAASQPMVVEYYPLTEQTNPQVYDVPASTKPAKAKQGGKPLGNPPASQGGSLSKSQVQKLLDQIDFYFSDSNFARDKFLQQQVAQNGGGVPISVIESFKRFSQLLEGNSISDLVPHFPRLKNCRFDKNEEKLFRVDASRAVQPDPNQSSPHSGGASSKQKKKNNQDPAAPNPQTPPKVKNGGNPSKPVTSQSRTINNMDIKVTTNGVFSESVDAIALAQISQPTFLSGKMGQNLKDWAGPDLEHELDVYFKHFTVCEGGAVITGAHKLNNCNFVVHAVCPYWKKGDEIETKLYNSAVVDSLHHAERSDCGSIAFSIFGMGKVPDDVAARLMLSTIKNYASYNPPFQCRKLQSVCICVPQKLFQLFKDELLK